MSATLSCAIAALAAPGVVAAPVAGSSTLSFLAGTGTAGAATSGVAATASPLSYPQGVAVDSAGNVYIAESSNHRIVKVDASTSQLSFVAGTGNLGAATAGVAATSSPLNNPQGVAVDSAGNVFIADSNNHRVEKVDASTGLLSFVAGDGTQGAATAGVAATSSPLNTPSGVAVDSAGNVYIADTNNHRINKVDHSTGQLSFVAGDGTQGAATAGVAATTSPLNSPQGVAVDSAGNVYIADPSNNRVSKVDASTGQLSFVAGTGTAGIATAGVAATSSPLSAPAGVAVDSAGNVYIADSGNNRVSKVDASTGQLSFVAGTGTGGAPTAGPATSSRLNYPYGVGVGAAGKLYIADTFNNRIEKVTLPTGTLPTITSTAPSTATAGAAFSATLVASGTPSTWSVSAGSLPSWLSLNSSTGVLSGTASSTPGAVPAFTVRATNTAGYDEQTINLTINALTAPGAPSAVTAVAGVASAAVSWAAPGSNGGSAITGYTVTAAPGGATCAAATVAGCSVTGLTPGTAYTFTVTATNLIGTGLPSAASTSVTPTAPPSSGGGSSLLVQQITTGAPSSLALNARTAALNAVASAGGTLSYTSGSPSVCTVDGAGIITAAKAGTCTITVTAAATATHAAASRNLTITITEAQTVVASLPAGPQRFAGADRVATSADIAEKIFTTPPAGTSRNVVLATAGSYADALPGSRLAGQVGGPLLLTNGNRLSDEAATQVKRLVAAGGTVYVLGGDKALSDAVESAVGGLVVGDSVQRIGGGDRYQTAAMIADATTKRAGDVGPIYLVTGRDFADGVSVAAYAQSTGGVVLLTDGDTLPAATAKYLADHDPKGERAVAIGGPAKAAATTAGLAGAAGRAVVGADRYETSAKLAAAMKTPTSTTVASVASVGMAGGASWPDALSGSAAMAALGGPLLLTPTGSEAVPAATTSALGGLAAQRVLVFGGTSVIPGAAYDRAGALLKG
ncbi:cell wall-binding repeat-containing protein [Quadrisphaera granulorum]|uniref:cell wall-binding repeat-containing protein n=1 Tax=Quadrisphaera granulorum TaxID=317664 RepID=UPI001472FC71|nr:cell wall-binding repeat-containing protein [Quadrisphaera granulorum]